MVARFRLPQPCQWYSRCGPLLLLLVLLVPPLGVSQLQPPTSSSSASGSALDAAGLAAGLAAAAKAGGSTSARALAHDAGSSTCPTGGSDLTHVVVIASRQTKETLPFGQALIARHADAWRRGFLPRESSVIVWVSNTPVEMKECHAAMGASASAAGFIYTTNTDVSDG